MLKRLKNRFGFSMLETTLAVAVMAIGLLAGLSVLQSNVSANIYLERNTIATQLANEKMEIILADKEYNGYSYVIDTNNYPQETLSGAFNGFTRTVTVTEVDENDLSTPSPGSGLNKIDIIVSWSSSPEDQLVMSTLVADVE